MRSVVKSASLILLAFVVTLVLDSVKSQLAGRATSEQRQGADAVGPASALMRHSATSAREPAKLSPTAVADAGALPATRQVRAEDNRVRRVNFLDTGDDAVPVPASIELPETTFEQPLVQPDSTAKVSAVKIAETLPPPVPIRLADRRIKVGDQDVATAVVASQSVFPVKSQQFTLVLAFPVVASDPPNVVVSIDNRQVATKPVAESSEFELTAAPGTHGIQIAVDRNGKLERLDELTILVRTIGPQIVGVNPIDLDHIEGPFHIEVEFDRANPITLSSSHASLFTMGLVNSGNPNSANNLYWNEVKQAATLTFNTLAPGSYDLSVLSGITDVFGHSLPPQTFRVVKPVAEDPLSATAGLRGLTGPNVAYPEFTKPREVPDGFNPSDKVETRVARLYYYRDAHRVAQIINRSSKSYNRAGVDMARQQADKALNHADAITAQRQAAEREAIRSAQQTRRKEAELRQEEQRTADTQRELLGTAREYQRLRDQNPEPGTPAANRSEDLPVVLDSLSQRLDAGQERINQLRREIEIQREQEALANEQKLKLESQEERARAEQFRREVAAAQADPDTYAPGVPSSDDPVEQVSASVIGEGLIHLRGPLKGVNIIRQMINRIDAPVGQARIAVHTVQINGERAERIEVATDKAQKYIDHARFLTTQSTEMFRKAVMQAAAGRASAEWNVHQGESQADRDLRYLDAFFGKDFIDELHVMDSEFLKTGNKLLSLHSMDTTSLASALLMLALAKNSVRAEILDNFNQLIQGQLPMAEQTFFEEGLLSCTDKRCQRLHLKNCRCEDFVPLSHNARFASLQGFFDAESAGDDLMTPLQREFLGLAQIFKARLVTEMEFRQRVMERAVIEERMGSREQELADARQAEKDAAREFAQANQMVANGRRDLIAAVSSVMGEVDANGDEIALNLHRLKVNFAPFAEVIQRAAANPVIGKQSYVLATDPNRPHRKQNIDFEVCDLGAFYVRQLPQNDVPPKFMVQTFETAVRELDRVTELVSQFNFGPEISERLDAVREHTSRFETPKDSLVSLRPDALVPFRDLVAAVETYEQLLDVHERLKRSEVIRELRSIGEALVRMLVDDVFEFEKTRAAYDLWIQFQHGAAELVLVNPERVELLNKVNAATRSFESVLTVSFEARQKQRLVEQSLRPLDHKKFLDMLIDDLEDKYIELMEGTRAHVANIDNYVKRIATALEDDFATQFYDPAFRCVRQAGRMRDVTFGQIETTTILANNREFAKVSPAATMEFDLPARDILITEGMNGAKALVDEYGALVSDPNFLALSSLGAGQSTGTAAAGTTGGLSTVRDVLPGLSTNVQESILSQNGSGRPQFGTALDNLIPDPAIYKFETGTGYEIRPVIQPDGQAVVFDFNYMYTTNIYEPVRADEKHLGRVKRHFIHTDVQLSNYELRQVSKYQVALRASRTARGVPLLEDVPVVGALFRPLPQAESSLQENIILAQATIFPTLFDLMGLRWAPAISDLDPLRLSNEEFLVRGRHRFLQNRVYDYSSAKVDEFLRIPESARRGDLYRTQETIPTTHPNGYRGRGLDFQESTMQEALNSNPYPAPELPRYIESESAEGAVHRRSGRASQRFPEESWQGTQGEYFESTAPGHDAPFDSEGNPTSSIGPMYLSDPR